MKKNLIKSKKLLALAVVLAGILFSISRVPQREVYVSSVIDGDTIELSSGETVRYIGIDTPEVSEKKGSGWVYNPRPYAEDAKDFNRFLVEGKQVRLELDIQKRDKYGRLLSYVYVGDKMVNMEMLKEGYAMMYTYPPNVKYTEEFLVSQTLAREHNKGLWSRVDEGAIFPYETKENIGFARVVEAEVLSTFISEKVLMLNTRDNFKIVIFKNNLLYFPVSVSRSPEAYFKHKRIRVYGLIQEYKGASEIIVQDPSQIEIIN
ncbi:thermonuclease family protein [Candidatus Omnitrophota bacterium]